MLDKINLENQHINSLPWQTAMAPSPSHIYSCTRNSSLLFDKYKNYPKQDLLQILLDFKTPLNHRYVCGIALSLEGDPRLNPFEPQMIEFEDSEVIVGTEPHQIKALYSSYRCLGVEKKWLEKETPSFKKEIKGFRMAHYPVTNFEYQIFLQQTRHPHLPTSWTFGRYPLEKANHPVWTVSQDDAKTYCQWLSGKTGRAFRLPTEIEWEYAAKGNERREFPWGNVYHKKCCNTAELKLLTTTPIGMFPLGNTPEGIADMGGNVEEIIDGIYFTYSGGKTIEDDLFTHNNNYVMTRGGCFTRFRDLARCTRRHGFINNGLYAIGFRIAESIHEVFSLE